MSRLVCLGLLAAITACGPAAKDPLKVMALVPDEAGTLATTEVELTGLTDVAALKGSVVQLVGSTKVVVDANDPTQQVNGGIANMSDDQRYEVIVKDKGGPVRGHFVDRSGTLWPADFHTWNMVSAYYNFQKSYDYFNQISPEGGANELRPLTVHYWSDVYLNTSTPLTDNALYLSFIKGFVVVPFKDQQLVPLAMNIGVIGHEVAHRSFNIRALNKAGVHPALGTWNLRAFNWLKSLDEGLADFHGFSVTCFETAGCRPNFLAQSLDPSSPTVRYRNVANTDACMDENLRTHFENATQLDWISSPDMYRVGNLVAASLYQAGNKLGKIDVLQKALILAYDDIDPKNPGIRQLIEANMGDSALGQKNFTPEAVVDIIAGHVTDPELKKAVCTEFSTRMQLRCGAWPCELDNLPAMTHCPITARRENTCPLLQQP
ncbi:MAG: hypothetical protein ACOZQL_32070 [Myxococcota bacterium]